MPISVNAGVSRDRLNIVVTTPDLASLTQCGKGNALYDQTLDAIFIDIHLIRPVELQHIGNSGAITMASSEEFGFVASTVSCILVHELGHRQSGKGSAAFLALDWLRFNRNATERELAADRFAVQTLVLAHQAGDAPDFLAKNNALDFTGLSNEVLNAKERGAADILAQ